jgi:hypothetical protein
MQCKRDSVVLHAASNCSPDSGRHLSPCAMRTVAPRISMAPVLLEFGDGRRAQKERFGGELFLADRPAGPAGTRFLEYFQRDRDTGRPKGIVQIDLEVLT